MSIRGSQTFVWDTNKMLGQGATSMVYMGRNKKTGDEVAVKVFNPQSYHRPFPVQMREFEVMRKLSHDNIVKLLAIEEELPSRAKVIVMEYCTHGSLYNLLDLPENNFGLSEEEFVNVLKQVTAGVKHLRDQDIIHRDIKPGNILRSVAPDGTSVFKLTDFGAARELQQDEEFASLYGTDEYLHPDMYERAVLRRPLGQHFGVYVDLWSLGVTFYHAATGNLPFRPYGGRRNKETMHMITAKKEHGIISGVQEQQNGPIRWERDLPLTCRLSKGLKLLITPFLADLLEKDQAKTITFDEYFSKVHDITSRIPYDVFCPTTFSLITVYTRLKDDMSQLRQLITEQTDIPGGAQLLLHDGKVLTHESRDPVSKYLKHITPDNPIFVFNKLPEFKKFVKPVYGLFKDIPTETNVANDYPLAKKNFAALYSVRNAVKKLVHNDMLVTKAVKMYSNYVHEKSSHLEHTTFHVTRLCTDTKAWIEQLFASVGLQVGMFRALANSGLKAKVTDVVSQVNMLQTVHQTGKRECLQINSTLQTKLDKATELLQLIKSGHIIDSDWDPSKGCMPADRCIEKIDNMIQRVQKILNSFREDRSKVTLNNNDEQIHRFDKNKMKELCITATTLVDDDCTKNAQQLFVAFRQFYAKAVQIHDSGERLEGIITEVVNDQGRLVGKLKGSGKQCLALTENCLTALGQTTISNGDLTEQLDNAAPSDVNSTGSRKERLDSVLDSLQNTRSSLEEVRALITENTSLMERFSTLGETSEEYKDWELLS
ncbi:serine/threonine-protein kinase TBK1-like [Physella acuta]|uniref:serine/threonine-protein kinase TBK1-like n=1 Tax=Physella acuta TaxID=109671 RepID=UPI0027DCADA5|nr:serine/threonine-protein kinase TBK1-like [Physella acuta]